MERLVAAQEVPLLFAAELVERAHLLAAGDVQAAGLEAFRVAASAGAAWRVRGLTRKRRCGYAQPARAAKRRCPSCDGRASRCRLCARAGSERWARHHGSSAPLGCIEMVACPV
jgi:hypothetical protein